MKTPKQTTKRAAIYTRQSSTDNASESISLAQQVDDARILCEKNGWVVVLVAEDADRSGSLPPKQWRSGIRAKYREGLTRVIEAVEKKEVDVVICRKLDRLSRQTLEFSTKLLTFFEKNGVSVACTHESSPDFSSPSGEFQINLLLSVSRFERARIQANVKAAKDYLRRNGKKHKGSTTIGYKDGPNKTVEIDHAKLPIVKEVFARFLNGQSYYQIVEWLKSEHAGDTMKGGIWHTTQVKTILRNPLYIGKAYVDGNLLDSKVYSPVIAEADWANAQAAMKVRKGTKTYNGRSFLLSGLIKCSYCGRSMEVMPQSGTDFKVYMCKGKHDSKENKVPFRMRVEWWEKWAEFHFSKDFAKSAPTTAANSVQTSAIKANLQRAKSMFAKGLLDADEFEAIVKEGKEKMKSLDVPELNPQTVIKWEDSTLDQKRAYLFELLSEIKVYNLGVKAEFKKGFKYRGRNIPDDVRSMVFSKVKRVGKAGKWCNDLEYLEFDFSKKVAPEGVIVASKEDSGHSIAKYNDPRRWEVRTE